MSQTPPRPKWARFQRGLGAPLLALALAACGGDPLEAEGDDLGSSGASLSSVRVRLMAANTTSGTYQSYDPGHGIRIFQGTKPDVVMIQEFNYGDNSASALRQFVDTAFGTSFSYYREGGAQIPNGVISRWPIIAAGEWDDPYVTNRDFAWARIDIPGPKDLWVVSVHLLTSDATTRNNEAISLVQRIQANIPAGDYLAIGGDFNTGSRVESCFSTLSQVVTTSGAFPVDQNGNGHTNSTRAKPYDHVLVDSDLRAYQTATVIGASSYTSGLVVDTRVYTPLYDIYPAQSGDSAATNMQHMAVIKDFLVPSDTTTDAGTDAGTDPGTDGGTHPVTDAGTDAGTDPISDGGTSPVSDAGTDAGTDGGTSPVSDAGTDPGTDGGTHPVFDAGTDGGTSPVFDAGTDAGTDGGTSPVFDAGTDAGTDGGTSPVFDAGTDAGTDGGTSPVFDAGTDAGTGTPWVIINEILANEPGSDISGEFVELVNVGSGAADLGGWTLSDATGPRHTFASGTSLSAGAAVVVFGAAAGIPAGLTNAVATSTGTLGLGNSGDTVTVKNAFGTAVDSFTYPSSLSSTDGVSMNRGPDASASGSFVLHTSLSSLSSSPGKRVDGTGFTAP